MRNVYTVKQVNSYIKNMFTQDFMLNRIYVKGEVSNCKYHTSGHIYFSLKDSSGTIACIMFAGQRAGLSFRMQEGQQVVVLGTVTTYERDGKYQLYAKEIILDGVGLLYEKFEALKKELEEMGMFAPEYKQPIPGFAEKIGIVTAPTGAAIRDIIHVAKRRNPFVQLILYPALVQGDKAAESVIKGIRMLEQMKVDVIIAGRGGGSIEDLWAFNDERLARAVFECRVPVISAVGHETDTTIIDYVADLRAPTPSAAAELAVYEYEALADRLLERRLFLIRAMTKKLGRQRERVEHYRRSLKYVHPQNRLREQRQRLAAAEEKLRMRMRQKIERERQRLSVCIERMKGLSPVGKLNQGYACVQNEAQETIRSVEAVKKGDVLSIYVSDGRIKAGVIESVKENIHGRE